MPFYQGSYYNPSVHSATEIAEIKKWGKIVHLQCRSDPLRWGLRLRPTDEPGDHPLSDASGYPIDHIPEYHGVLRPWVVETLGIKPTMLGVEVEIKANSYKDAVFIRDAANELGIVVERDSSLDRVRGIELIGPPIEARAYPKSVWATLLETLGQRAVGWEAGAGYGMHVSMNLAGLDQVVQAAIIKMVSNNPNFFALMAGRLDTAYCRCLPKLPTWTPLDVLNHSYGHTQATSFGNGRGEIRIFRSTVRIGTFLKNVELIAALRVFCSREKTDDLSTFLAWVLTETEQFPNLNRWINHTRPRRLWLQRYARPKWSSDRKLARDPEKSSNFKDLPEPIECLTPNRSIPIPAY